jgi:hypothetical protein
MKRLGRFGRLIYFVRDFLPEKPIQLIFPLGSFLLLLGSWTPWLPPHHVLVNPEYQASETDLWFDISSHLAMTGYSIARLCVSAAFLASIVLWSLSVNDPARKFRRWVVAPACTGIAIFTAIVMLSKDPRISVLESRTQVIQNVLGRFPGRIASLGTGFYLALIGVALIYGAVWGFTSGRIPLPVGFRNQRVENANEARPRQAGRNIFALVVATSVLAEIPSIFLFLIWGSKTLPRRWGTGEFPRFDWVLGTTYAAIAAICPAAVLGRSRWSYLKRLF